MINSYDFHHELVSNTNIGGVAHKRFVIIKAMIKPARSLFTRTIYTVIIIYAVIDLPSIVFF